MPRSISSAVVFALFATSTLPLRVHADDQDVIDYRKHIMKTLGEQTAAITQILQQKAPTDNFTIHLQILATTSATALKAFEPKVLGGDSKPDVWANWADFSKRMNELAVNTAELAKTAKQNGIAAAAPKVPTALACKSCHDIYEQKQ